VLAARIIAVDGATDLHEEAILPDRAELVVYGEIAKLQGSAFRRSAARVRPAIGRRLWSLLSWDRHHPPRLNPILARLAVATLAVFGVGTWYFHAAIGRTWLDAVYFVVNNHDDDRIWRFDA
jgi:hypothetical protein